MKTELKDLAQYIFDNYYSKKGDTLGYINLLEDEKGLVSQIDNMVAGLISDNLSLSSGTDLSLFSDELLLREILSRTYEQDAPIKTSYGDGMKTITVGIGADETATIAMHYEAIDLLRNMDDRLLNGKH